MKTFSYILSVVVIFGTLTLQAAIVSSSMTGNYPDQNPQHWQSQTLLSPEISSTDLLQTDLEASSISGFDPLTWSDTTPSLANGGNLFNGSADGADSAETFYFGEAYIDDGSRNTPWQVEFYMDISSNALGYDLMEIHSYSGWNSNVVSQNFTIEVSTVVSLDYISLGQFTYAADNTGLVVSITDDEGGPLASGVDIIRFTHHSDGTAAGRGAYRELDVMGSPTVIPEPATFILLLGALTVLLLSGCRRRG